MVAPCKCNIKLPYYYYYCCSLSPQIEIVPPKVGYIQKETKHIQKYSPCTNNIKINKPVQTKYCIDKIMQNFNAQTKLLLLTGQIANDCLG